VGVGGNHIISAPTDRDWSVPRFLIVAQDWRRKNVELVVRSFRELRAEQPTATLDVVGPYSGEAGPGVSLHGPLRLDVSAERGSVDALFRRSTCYVMPSTHEASALVFVEASWAGIPSIGTTVGGVRELIGDGGVVVNPDKPLELLDANATTVGSRGGSSHRRARSATCRVVHVAEDSRTYSAGLGLCL